MPLKSLSNPPSGSVDRLSTRGRPELVSLVESGPSSKCQQSVGQFSRPVQKHALPTFNDTLRGFTVGTPSRPTFVASNLGHQCGTGPRMRSRLERRTHWGPVWVPVFGGDQAGARECRRRAAARHGILRARDVCSNGPPRTALPALLPDSLANSGHVVREEQ
jgi:hypothetical protein